MHQLHTLHSRSYGNDCPQNALQVGSLQTWSNPWSPHSAGQHNWNTPLYNHACAQIRRTLILSLYDPNYCHSTFHFRLQYNHRQVKCFGSQSNWSVTSWSSHSSDVITGSAGHQSLCEPNCSGLSACNELFLGKAETRLTEFWTLQELPLLPSSSTDVYWLKVFHWT